jgi:hypothetical protein
VSNWAPSTVGIASVLDLRARPACREFETRQPTMNRLITSVTNATYTKPLHLLAQLTSATQRLFGAAALRFR